MPAYGWMASDSALPQARVLLYYSRRTQITETHRHIDLPDRRRQPLGSVSELTNWTVVLKGDTYVKTPSDRIVKVLFSFCTGFIRGRCRLLGSGGVGRWATVLIWRDERVGDPGVARNNPSRDDLDASAGLA
jgi:hypothetical protein